MNNTSIYYFFIFKAFKDIYAPLTSYAVNYLAIRIIKRILPRPSIILLNHNNLQDGGFIEALRIFNPSLKGLDLRHNKVRLPSFIIYLRVKYLNGGGSYDFLCQQKNV